MLRIPLLVALTLAVAGHAAAQDLARGEVLFNYCSQCHGTDGRGDPAARVPAIAGLEPWYVEAQLVKYREGIRGSHPDDINGLRMRPMSRTLKSDQDVTDVAAYVGTLSGGPPARTLAEPGDPARGEETYTSLCTTCHGPEAAGNQQLFAPPLRHHADWYLLLQLQNFKAGIRGGNPNDQTGIMMRPMSMTLADEQAMKDVVAYILTLSE